MSDDEFDALLGSLMDLTPEQRKLVSAQLVMVRNQHRKFEVADETLETVDPVRIVWVASKTVAEHLGLGMVWIDPTRMAQAYVNQADIDEYTGACHRLMSYVEHHVAPRSYKERWRAVYKILLACFHADPFPKKRTISVKALVSRISNFEGAVNNQYPGYAAAGQLRFALL